MAGARESRGRTDEELVAIHRHEPAGEAGRAALDELIGRWSDRAYAWAYQMVRDRERALDVAQDALVQMMNALPRYEPRGRFGAWLFVIVHHRVVSETRKRSLDFDPEIDPDELISGTDGPEIAHESAETKARIFAAMEQVLDERERTALWMRAYEGLGVDEITRILKIEGATGARGLMQTARRKLRAALAADSGKDAKAT